MFLLQKRGVQLPFLHQMVDTSVCVILNDVAVVRLSMKRKKKSEALRRRKNVRSRTVCTKGPSINDVYNLRGGGGSGFQDKNTMRGGGGL